MDQIAISFNRRWLWGVFGLMVSATAFIFLFAVMTITSVFWGYPKTETYMRVVGGIELPLLILMAIILFSFTTDVGRSLWKKTPACVLTPEGIIDNCSSYWLGLLRWDEMEKIYIADIPNHSRVIKLKHRVVVIRFKDLNEIRPRLPYWKRLSLRMERTRSFVCIYERSLNISASEFMDQLNGYYRAQIMDRV